MFVDEEDRFIDVEESFLETEVDAVSQNLSDDLSWTKNTVNKNTNNPTVMLTKGIFIIIVRKRR